MKIVPAGPAVKEMKREAEKCEQKARTEQEPHASTFREKAAVFREWIVSLKTGTSTS
jgi:hypothetical protein